MRTLKAGVIYFLLVFGVGWILGPIWELWAVPPLGRVASMLLEAVIMLTAMIVAARWVIRWFDVPQALGATISMGLMAIGLLIPAEYAGVVWCAVYRCTSIWRAFADAPGVISLFIFLLFAAMPTLVMP